MRTLMGCGVVLLLAAAPVSAQFRNQATEESRVSQSIYTGSGSSLLFGWFDPSKFSMRHSLQMSYMTMGGGEGFSLGTYTNSMMYQFAPNLDVRADVSVSYSPFQSFASGLGGKRNDLSKIYLSRADVSYRPWENTMIQFSFRQYPFAPYGMFSNFHDPWYREGGF